MSIQRYTKKDLEQAFEAGRKNKNFNSWLLKLNTRLLKKSTTNPKEEAKQAILNTTDLSLLMEYRNKHHGNDFTILRLSKERISDILPSQGYMERVVGVNALKTAFNESSTNVLFEKIVPSKSVAFRSYKGKKLKVYINNKLNNGANAQIFFKEV